MTADVVLEVDPLCHPQQLWDDVDIFNGRWDTEVVSGVLARGHYCTFRGAIPPSTRRRDFRPRARNFDPTFDCNRNVCRRSSIASSSDFSVLVAAVWLGAIYVSLDYGVSWTTMDSG